MCVPGRQQGGGDGSVYGGPVGMLMMFVRRSLGVERGVFGWGLAYGWGCGWVDE